LPRRLHGFALRRHPVLPVVDSALEPWRALLSYGLRRRKEVWVIALNHLSHRGNPWLCRAEVEHVFVLLGVSFDHSHLSEDELDFTFKSSSSYLVLEGDAQLLEGRDFVKLLGHAL
jgi:hypothetical protein